MFILKKFENFQNEIDFIIEDIKLINIDLIDFIDFNIEIEKSGSNISIEICKYREKFTINEIFKEYLLRLDEFMKSNGFLRFYYYYRNDYSKVRFYIRGEKIINDNSIYIGENWPNIEKIQIIFTK